MAYLRLVRPVRAEIAIALLLITLIHAGHAAENKWRATLAYKARITEVAQRAIDSGLTTKHPERLGGVSMALEFQVDPRGHVHSVRVVGGKPDRWAEKTAMRVLRATRFPPIPQDVLRELEMDHLDAGIGIRFR